MAFSSVAEAAAIFEGCGIEDADEEDLVVSRCSEADTLFDTTVGHLEDIVMGEKFQSLQTEFLEKYCREFEDSEENKFIYSDIHKNYTQQVEKFLEDELSSRMPGFNMNEFQAELVQRKDEIEGEIFEILLMFTDFMAFKEMMLDYRADKEGRNSFDLSSGIRVTPLNVNSPGGSSGQSSASVDRRDDQRNATSGNAQAVSQRCNNSGSVESDLDFCIVGKAVRQQQDGSK